MRKTNNIPVQIFDIPFPDTWDIERQVLADAISAPEFLGDVFPAMHPDFFTSETRRRIWDKIAEKYNLGETIDMSVMLSAFGKDFHEEVLPKMGALPGMLEVTAHVAALRSGAARRRAYIAAVQYLQMAVSNAAEEQDIIAGAEDFAAQVEGPSPLQTETTLAAAIKAVREDVHAAEKAAAEGKSIRVATGFEMLDIAIGSGFKPGQLVVLAARPGVGKTSIMIHLAKNAARSGNPVYISTLEMTDGELAEKFLYSTGRVRPYEVSHGSVKWDEFDVADEELKHLPIIINQFSRTLEQIIGRITQAVKQGRCKVAMIDYLGLVQDCTMLGGGVKLYQVIAKITGTLKAVAKRLGIPIVLLCQLNRDQVRENRHPELFDLRDSGSIEQDADIVLMLEREKDSRSIIAWLRKNRNGRNVDENGHDIGFRLLPNETYSAFEELGPVHDNDLPAPEPLARPLPEPVTTREEEFEDNLPF